MLKNILKLEGVKKIDKKDQSLMLGGSGPFTFKDCTEFECVDYQGLCARLGSATCVN